MLSKSVSITAIVFRVLETSTVQESPFYMYALFNFISMLITLYIWVIVINAVMSWLIAFNVVNMRNRFVYTVMDTLHRLTEPALRPIRRFLPDLGGIDISPVILIVFLISVQSYLLPSLLL